MGTQAALATLNDARLRGQAAVTAAMAAFEEEARQSTAAGGEQNAAAEALTHLEPLRNNARITERFAPQMQEIFFALEAITRPNREAELATAREQRQGEAEQTRRCLENEARLQIQEGHLSVRFGDTPLVNSVHEDHLNASFGHAPLDEAQGSFSQEGHLSESPEQALQNDILSEPQSSSSQVAPRTDLDDIIAIRRQRWLASQQSNAEQH
jgi:hypothetical protein